MKLKELRQNNFELLQQIGDLKKDRASIGNAAVAEGRSLTASERERFATTLPKKIAALEAEHRAVAVDLAAAEEAHEAERARILAGDGYVDEEQAFGERQIARSGLGRNAPAAQPFGANGRRPTFAAMFPRAHSPADVMSPADFLRAVSQGMSAPGLVEFRADSMNESVPSSGGYVVPTELAGTLLDTTLEAAIVMSRAAIWPMTSSELQVPALDDLDRSSGAIGGTQLQFASELSTLTPQVAKLRMLHLHARRGAIFLEISNDLLQDSGAFEGRLIAKLTQIMQFGLDSRFLFGAGSDGPVGALVAPCTIGVTRTTAGRVFFEDVSAMLARLTPGSLTNAIWIAHPSCIPDLLSMSIAIGTAGALAPALLNQDGKYTLLTRPLIFSEQAKNIGTQSDISLCDFSAYSIGLRREITLDKSAHVGFQRDVQTYRLQLRVDGLPNINAPITPLNGTNTLSPFVTLV